MNRNDTHDDDLDSDEIHERDAAEEREALLTAYALGETDAAQNADVEALLASDSAARAALDEIRATAALLADGFAAETPEHLPEPVREAVASAAQPAPAGRVKSLWPLVGMAASVAAGVGIAGWLGAPERKAVEEARLVARGRDVRSDSDLDEANRLRALGYVSGPHGEPRRPDLNQREQRATRSNAALTADETAALGRESWRRVREVGDGQSGRMPESGPSGDPSVVNGPRTADPAGFRGVAHGGQGGGGGGGSPLVQGGRAPGSTTYYGQGGGGGGGGARMPGVDGERKKSPSGWAGNGGAGGGGGAEDLKPLVGGAGGSAGRTELQKLPAGAEGDGADPHFGTATEGATEAAEIAELRAQMEQQITILRNELSAGGATVLHLLSDARLRDVGAQVAGVRRVIADGYLADSELGDDANEVVQLYDQVVTEVRRRKADEFRRRYGFAYGVPGAEDYDHPGESTFRDPADEPLSTFSIDVDTASYANVRRFLHNGQLPPPAAVRIEEMVNSFKYDDPAPTGEHPIAATLETATCPWNTKSRLVRVGIKAKTFDEAPPPANLVFLLDVSGSMQSGDKLPLLQRAMGMLTEQMREGDRVAIVTYASSSGVALESTDGSDKAKIKSVIDGLSAGGSTNGGSGIIDAYRIAQEHFVKGGINRVILATDGDFNVGVTDRGELTKLIEQKRESGVFLSVLGVGTGNLKDATLERLADRGNGNYHYLDGLREARKVLVEELMGTVATVAKDVKIQIEFNPVTVGAYRLIGYENRMLAAADFNDDTKDAGEMGAGHTVTALYEIVPAGTSPQEGVDDLRYQKNPPREATEAAKSGELLTLKVRYKQPDGTESTRFDMQLKDSEAKFDEASEDLRFASAVASFGMLLRNSPAAAGTSYDAVLEVAGSAVGDDPGGHRAELLDLVLKAKTLSGN